MDLGITNIFKIEYWVAVLIPVMIIILAIENLETSKKIIFYIMDKIINVFIFVLGAFFNILGKK
jgi:hypothetical protein